MSTKDTNRVFFKNILKNIPAGMHKAKLLYNDKGDPIDYLILDTAGLYIDFIGIDREEIIGKKASDFVPIIEPGWFLRCREILIKRKVESFDLYSNYLESWLNVIIKPLDREDEFTFVYTDITKHKEMEVELRESKEQQSFILRLTDELRSQSDEDSIKDKTTHLLADYFQVSQSSFSDYFTEDKILITREVNRDRILNMKGEYNWSDFASEINLLLLDKDVVYSSVYEYPEISVEQRSFLLSLNIWANITVPLIRNNRLVASLSVRNSSPKEWSKEDIKLVREVAERTWLAIERVRFEKALQESESKYRKLFETSNEGFWWLNKDGYVVDINEGISRMLGYREEEIVGRQWTSFVPAEWVGIGFKEWETNKGGRSSRDCLQLRKKDGSYLWVIISSTPLMDKSGKYTGSLLAIKDITKEKKADEELYKSRQVALELVDKLQKEDKNKDQFISMLSHEVRNPLATISGGLDLLELNSKDENTLNILQIMKRQTDHLSKLIDDLLDITRISKKKVVIRKETSIINKILRDIVFDLRVQYEKKGVELLDKIPADPVEIYADPLRITQCIGNILGNSLKFTEKGGTVSISLRKENNRAVIDVVDTGKGISPEVLPNIFDPFKQDLSNNYHNMGLGLGLSIVKETIRMHDGDVIASSPGLGKGSKFTIWLPVIQNKDLKLVKGGILDDTLNR